MSRSQRPVWLGEDKRQWDHVRVHVQLLRDPRLTNASDGTTGVHRSVLLAVYLGVAAHAELATGDAHPSQATLADYVGASTKTVQRAVAVLANAGYMEVEDRPGMASVYRLLPPPTLDVGTQVCDGALDVEVADPGRGDARSPDVGTREQEPVEQEKNNEVAASDDAVALCELLAERILNHRGGEGAPRVTSTWTRDMGLLLRRGPLGISDAKPLTYARVMAAINYTFEHLSEPGRDGFCWADQIQSPGGLRRKYQQIRDERRKRERSEAKHDGPSPYFRDWREDEAL